MSNSYKYPIFKQKQDRRSKRSANKRIRKYKLLENFKGFGFLKKLFNPWDICDYKIIPYNEESKLKARRK